jgi:hypothetical protein
MGNLSSDNRLLDSGRVPPPVGRPRARTGTRRESRPAHRLMSSTGYSSRVALQHCPVRFTGCRHSAMNESCRSSDLQRTANCVLTICLTPGGKRRLLRKSMRLGHATAKSKVSTCVSVMFRIRTTFLKDGMTHSCPESLNLRVREEHPHLPANEGLADHRSLQASFRLRL